MSDHLAPDRAHYVAKNNLVRASVSAMEVIRRRDKSRQMARGTSGRTTRHALAKAAGASAPLDPGLVALLPRLNEVVQQARKAISDANIESMVRIMLPGVDPVAAVRSQIDADNAVARVRFLETVPCHDSWALASMLGRPPANARATARRWIKARLIFAVSHQGRNWYPSFQFPDGWPHQTIAAVLTTLPIRMSSWQIAFWFVSSNPWLDGAVPSVHISDPDRLVQAARMVDQAAG